MGGNRGAGVKFSQDRHPARGIVLVQHQQFDAGIWPRLPGLVFGQSDVLEHRLIERGRAKIASQQSKAQYPLQLLERGVLGLGTSLSRGLRRRVGSVTGAKKRGELMKAKARQNVARLR